MSLSTNTREIRKRRLVQAQIDANLDSTSQKIDVCGRPAKRTIIYPMDMYSTKFMTPEDQFVLAVDRVESPEVKAALAPDIMETEQYVDKYDESVFDYVARLSLNGGDQGALKTIESKLYDVDLRCYMFPDGNEGEDFEINEKMVADYEATSELHFDDSKRVWTDQDITEKDLPNTKFVLMYKQQTNDKMDIMFDLYDGGSLSGNPGVPSASASMTIEKDPTSYSQDKLKWEYIISIHVKENKKPKDAIIKAIYLVLQRFMRAIIVTLGIIPSKL